MKLSIALDGAKRRDIRLYEGDTDCLEVVVYAKDGDEEPIDAARITGLRMTTAGPFAGTLPVGVTFTVPTGLRGRNRFILTGLVNGVRTTLAYGRVLGNCEILP